MLSNEVSLLALNSCLYVFETIYHRGIAGFLSTLFGLLIQAPPRVQRVGGLVRE